MRTRLRFSGSMSRSPIPAPLHALWVVLSIATTAHAQASRPVAIPGLDADHGLTHEEVGAVLTGELLCDRCHSGAPVVSDLERAAPDLSDVGGRIEPGYLARFIADPAGTHPGSKMPALLRGEAPDRRRVIAEAIADFLVDRSSSRFEADPILEDDAAAGAALFHEVGCIVCHSPRRPPPAGRATSEPRPRQVDLSIVPRKYSLPSLSRFLYDPRQVRPSGRMPDLGLSKAEANALASYLLGSMTRAAPSPEPASIAAGRRYFTEYRCSACHALEGVESPPPVARGAESRSEEGCLSPSSSTTPRYALGPADREALAAAWRRSRRELDEDARLRLTLTVFHCFGCHSRDGSGGVAPALDPYFTTRAPDLGDEARLPPPLTGVGAKLQPAWLRRVLFDGGSVRHYMSTRMPRYGEGNLAHLPELFERLDSIEPFEIPSSSGRPHQESREAGRRLAGSQGLSCISCHGFNGKPSTNLQGIDLISTTERLTPSWFARFLLAPQSFRPGTVMPEFWPGGVATHRDILGGDTGAQIRALWTYLSEGRTVRDPEGLRPERSVLTVGDEPVLYRGRSRVAGFRGIAIGYPGGLSLAFDAQTGTLAAIWRGDFVSVNWSGQGAGDFQPGARPIQLARDVSFYRLASESEPWPLAPVRTEESPVNPDPTYPRNRGYRFDGYWLDGESGPIVRYRSGRVQIEDRFEAEPSADPPRLRRFLKLTAPERDTLYLRALTGELETTRPGTYRSAELRLSLPDVPVVLREARGDAPSELLLRLHLPTGETRLRMDYELLR